MSPRDASEGGKSACVATSVEWWTPQWLVDLLAAEFTRMCRFTLDAAAKAENAKAENYFSLDEGRDGLHQAWYGDTFVNPPFKKGNTGYLWLSKAVQEIEACRPRIIVMVVAARTDTRAWHECVLKRADEVRYLRGRLPFLRYGEGVGGSGFPTAIVVFRRRTEGVEYGYPRFTYMDSKPLPEFLTNQHKP